MECRRRDSSSGDGRYIYQKSDIKFFHSLSPSVEDAATYVAALCINKVCKVLVWRRTFGETVSSFGKTSSSDYAKNCAYAQKLKNFAVRQRLVFSDKKGNMQVRQNFKVCKSAERTGLANIYTGRLFLICRKCCRHFFILDLWWFKKLSHRPRKKKTQPKTKPHTFTLKVRDTNNSAEKSWLEQSQAHLLYLKQKQISSRASILTESESFESLPKKRSVFASSEQMELRWFCR